MNDEFAIAPWEHCGADFDPAPHAAASLEVGGKTRRLLFKERDGVIYFKEPHLESLWAIPRVFPSFVDEEALIETARWELNAGNYGRYGTPIISFEKISGSARVCVVRRADGSGMAKEWFEPKWKPLKHPDSGLTPDLWASRLRMQKRLEFSVANLDNSFLNRAISPDWRHDIPTRWVNGDAEQLQRMLELIFQLERSKTRHHEKNSRTLLFSIHAHSPANDMGLSWGASIKEKSPRLFSGLWQTLRTQFVFVGLSWIQATPAQSSSDIRNNKVEASQKRWGENWRGNWFPQSSVEVIRISSFSPPTASEKVKLALELEQRLQGKTPARQIRKLLRFALQP